MISFKAFRVNVLDEGVDSAAKKPENYVAPDGKVHTRMVPAKKDVIKKDADQHTEGSDDPCWDSHKQVGMKKKGGKMVPNCVPKEQVEEAKATACGRCGTTHVPPAQGGTCPALKKEEVEQVQEELPDHLKKILDKKGNIDPKKVPGAKKSKVTDVTPKGYGPKEEVELGERLEKDGPKKDLNLKTFGAMARAVAGGGASAKYVSRKAKQRQDMNKKNDPGAAKKGLALSVIDREKARIKARKNQMKEHAEEQNEAKLSGMELHNKIGDRNLLIKAIKTAEKMSGNMTGAVREIEKMKKGLSKHKAVQAALQQANESVDQIDGILEQSDTFHVKVGDGRDHMIVKTKAKNSREAVKKIKSQYPKDRVSLYRESVELEEAADFEKMSKELMKHKSKGIEFEKAAAFARVMFMNSSLHVQDKAMKGMLTLLKNIDDLTVKTTLIKILKDNGFKVKGGRVMREEVELEEALQHVHTIKIDGNAPRNPKPFEVREIKDDFKTHVQAVRSAIKSNGGLVTDTETPSKSNNYVGRIMVGTRGDASKIDTKSIEKAVKRHGVEIHGNQFESVELDENYRTLATHGMGTETKNSINVGRGVDYYEPKNGDKRMGKVTKMTRSGYVVKDEKDGKSHTFAFHDRAKAKEIMAKSK